MFMFTGPYWIFYFTKRFQITNPTKSEINSAPYITVKMYVINIMLDRETVPEGSFNQSSIERDSNLIPGPTERTLL